MSLFILYLYFKTWLGDDMDTINITSCSACGEDHQDLSITWDTVTHEEFVECPVTGKSVYIIRDTVEE